MRNHLRSGFVVALLASVSIVMAAQSGGQPPAPAGAVARCDNGEYVFVATGDATCSAAGGVAEWLPTETAPRAPTQPDRSAASGPSTQGGSSTNPVAASSPASCVLPFEGNTYAAWICDEAGKQITPRASLFFVRTNLNGAVEAQRIWAGASSELGKAAPEVIARHKAVVAGCRVFFHIVGLTGGEVRWNYATSNIQKWWKEAAPRHPNLCYVAEPLAADFAVVWQDVSTRIPYSFSLPVPQTSFNTGSFDVYGPNGYSFGTYSGMSTTTQMRTYQGSRTEWNVTVSVLPIVPKGNSAELVFGTRAFSADNTGRWRWSKPDKDGFEAAIGFFEQIDGRHR